MTINRHVERPDWLKKVEKKTVIHLDTLEDYHKKSEESSEYLEKCRELAEEYYDLTGEFYNITDNYRHVWGVQEVDEQYIKRTGNFKKLFGTQAILSGQLKRGILDYGYNIDEIPKIACMEYILVPTGNVEYFDPQKVCKKDKDSTSD